MHRRQGYQTNVTHVRTKIHWNIVTKKEGNEHIASLNNSTPMAKNGQDVFFKDVYCNITLNVKTL